jgi:hypothetical protein
VAQVGGFFLVAGRGERQVLARLVNDLESIPNTDGGGALSPRLEAELLAMLTRTSPPHVTSAERSLTAALFGLLGMVLGAAGVLGFLLLTQLSRSVQEQSDRLDKIAAGVDRASAAQRLTIETMLAGGLAKDAEHADAFLTQYRNTARLLDESKSKLDQQATINGELAGKLQTLDKENSKLRGDLELAKKYEGEAKEAATLRERVGELESDNWRQKRKLAAQQEVLDTAAGRRAVDLSRRYDRAWYAAVAGWGAALVLALGLLAAFGLKPLPAPESESEPGVAPPPSGLPEGRVPEPPPHHIT